MRNRKSKFALVSLLLSLFLAVMGTSGAIAAPQSELTAEEKFQALVDAGIFDGESGGMPSLDGEMTRAQAAVLIAKMMGLEQNSTAATYQDLDGADWAAGFIGAVTEAGIMQGYGDGIFDPGGNVTLEQLAVIVTKTLGLDVQSEAEVEGASDWAAGYVKAAVEAGLISATNDYTLPARNETLVETSYAASSCLSEPALAVTDAKLDLGGDNGVLTLGFTTAISADSVQSDTIVVNGAKLRLDKDQVAVSEDGKTLTITLKEAYDRPSGEAEPAIEVGGIQTACSKPMPEASPSVALEVVNEPPAKPKPPVEPEPSSEPESPSSDPSPWISASATTVTADTYSTMNITVQFADVDSIAYRVVHPIATEPPTAQQILAGSLSDYSYFLAGDCINVVSSPLMISVGDHDDGWSTQPFRVYLVGVKGSYTSSVKELITTYSP